MMRTLILVVVLGLLSVGGFVGAQDTIHQIPQNRVVIANDNLSQIQMFMSFESAGGSIADIAFDPESNLIAVTSREGLLIWDLHEGDAKWRLPIKFGYKVDFSSDGKMFVAASYPSVYLWSNLENNQSWMELKRGDGQYVGAVGDVRFSEDNSQVVVILAQNRGIYRWQTDTKEILFEQYSASVDESTLVSSAILSNDIQIGALEANPERLEILDAVQGNLLSSPTLSNELGNDFGIALLIFSPDNDLVLNVQSPAHSATSSIIFLSPEGEINRQIIVDYEAIWVVGAFSPDGSLLAVANEVDDKIHFFNVEDTEEISSVDTQADSVTSLAFSPDGTLLASGGTDGTVRLWGVPAGDS
jgi:WD40 repeat protein